MARNLIDYLFLEFKSNPIKTTLALVTVAMAIASIVVFFNNQPIQPSDQTNIALNNKINNLDKKINDLNSRIAPLELSINASKNNGTLNNISTNVNLLNINHNYTTLDNRISVIEKAILDNPERSLEVYKLAIELESLKEDEKSNLDNTRNDINRVYNLASWFLATLVTLTLGFLGLSFRKKE